MTTIKLIVSDESLVVSENPVVTSGDVNTVALSVGFSSEWDGLGKSAVFFTKKDPTVYEIVLSDGSCNIPSEVLSSEDDLFIGVRGVSDDGKVKTSSLVKYKILRGAPEGDGIPVNPTPNVYKQLLGAYGELYDRMISESKRIDEVVSAGHASETINMDNFKNVVTYTQIWSNPNSGSALNTLSLNIASLVPDNDYVGFLITLVTHKGDSNPTKQVRIDVVPGANIGNTVKASGIIQVGNDRFYAERSISIGGVNSTLEIGTCSYINDNLSNFAISGTTLNISDVNRSLVTNNDYMVPIKIYVIKNVASGSALMPKDAEIAEARIGYEGTQYESLGASIRSQASGLNDSIKELSHFVDTKANAISENKQGLNLDLTNSEAGRIQVNEIIGNTLKPVVMSNNSGSGTRTVFSSSYDYGNHTKFLCTFDVTSHYDPSASGVSKRLAFTSRSGLKCNELITVLPGSGNNKSISVEVYAEVGAKNDSVVSILEITSNNSYPVSISNFTLTPIDAEDYRTSGDMGYFDGKLKPGYYDNNGNYQNTDNNNVCGVVDIPCNGGDYVKIVANKYTSNKLRIPFYDENGNFIKREIVDTNTITVSAPSNSKFFRFSVNNTVNGADTSQNIVITINGNYAIRIKERGNNLFDKDNPSVVNSYLNATGDIISSESDDVSNWIPVKPNTTYTLQNVYGEMVGYGWYDSSKNFINGTNYNASYRDDRTVTSPDNASYLRITAYHDVAHTIQVVEGSATSYQSYYPTKNFIVPISEPLYSVGSLHNKLVKKDGKWYEHKVVGCVDLGSLTFVEKTEDPSGLKRFDCESFVFTSRINNYSTMKFNATSSVSTANHTPGVEEICVHPQCYLMVYTSKTSASQLSGVKLIYELATPQYEEIIDQDVLYELETYYDHTHVETVDGITTLDVSYNIDLRSYIDSKFSELASTLNTSSVGE